uniref:Uncharacterized protein n=1 Tax=Tanacetum cinerariifolium TaxID=118510 RepID=A0A699X2I5_TANCI|nr:hypothetical protein [Tanacetum cinerariifolium]
MRVLKAVLKAHKASSSFSVHKARFSPTVLSKILLRPRLVTSTDHSSEGGMRLKDDGLPHTSTLLLGIDRYRSGYHGR